MSHQGDKGDEQGFAHWSSYGPGKADDGRASDARLTPLNRDELRAEALRFRRGAEAAATEGDASKVEILRRAADDFDRRAEELGQL